MGKIKRASIIILITAIINSIFIGLLLVNSITGVFDYVEGENDLVGFFGFYSIYKIIIYSVILFYLIALKKEYGDRSRLSSSISFAFLSISIGLSIISIIGVAINSSTTTMIGFASASNIDIVLNISVLVMISKTYRKDKITTLAIIVGAYKFVVYPALGAIAFIGLFAALGGNAGVIEGMLPIVFVVFLLESLLMVFFTISIYKANKTLIEPDVLVNEDWLKSDLLIKW